MMQKRHIKFEIVFKNGRRAAYSASNKTNFVLLVATLKKNYGSTFRIVKNSIKVNSVIELSNAYHKVIIVKGAA